MLWVFFCTSDEDEKPQAPSLDILQPVFFAFCLSERVVFLKLMDLAYYSKSILGRVNCH